MPNLVKFIQLTEEDKATLEGILRQSTVEARMETTLRRILANAKFRTGNFSVFDIPVEIILFCP